MGCRTPTIWGLSALCFGSGCDAVLAPTKGAVGLTPTVLIPCGGADDVPFLKVKNISSLIRKLQERGW